MEGGAYDCIVLLSQKLRWVFIFLGEKNSLEWLYIIVAYQLQGS